MLLDKKSVRLYAVAQTKLRSPEADTKQSQGQLVLRFYLAIQRPSCIPADWISAVLCQFQTVLRRPIWGVWPLDHTNTSAKSSMKLLHSLIRSNKANKSRIFTGKSIVGCLNFTSHIHSITASHINWYMPITLSKMIANTSLYCI